MRTERELSQGLKGTLCEYQISWNKVDMIGVIGVF